MNKVSAIVIAKNAQELIPDCLESLGWVDEVIVVDTGSTDKTKAIASSFHAKIVSVQKKGFSYWRNLGAKEASGDWLFYVDTDERVTPELRKEIVSTSKKPLALSAYAVPRKNILLGHPMRWGGWWPDYVLRLIKKDSLAGWKGELHEQPEIKGSVGKLKNPLVHNSHRSLEEMVAKTNEWSDIEAKLLFDSGHPQMAWWRFISVAAREFWYRGILKLGFLDGVVGVIEIIYQMFSRMITYAKLWEMQKAKK
jgi:glycosyltransferase involved in cell wall biosynthesis